MQKSWKEIREQLSSDNFQNVIEYWSNWPITSRLIDPFDCENWPTAWELVDNKAVCEFSRALGMAYTFVYAGDTWKDNTRLLLVNDGNNYLMVLIIDNIWVLNYSHGDKVPLESIDLSVIKEFKFDNNKFFEL